MSVTTPPTLTAAPTTPDRSDRATFSARAVALDDFVKNTHIPELQAVANNVHANAVETKTNADIAVAIAETAAASANYKGDWPTLTGALNMPASVSYAGTFWVLGANVANVAAEVPGTSAAWIAMVLGNIPPVEIISDHTLALTDAGRVFIHPPTDTAARNINVPANSSVPFPKGSVFIIANENGAGVLNILIPGTEVMRLAPTGTTGNRSLAPNGVATLLKVAPTRWMITGMGLS